MLDVHAMHRRLPLIATLIIAGTGGAACGSAASQRPADAPHSARIERFEIVGNQAFNDREITSRLHYRPTLGRRAQWYVPTLLELDTRRVEAFYRAHGYFSAKATSRVIPGARGGVTVRIFVREGDPTRIRNVSVVGVPADASVTPQDALESAGIEPGAVFVHEQYVTAREQILDEVTQAGYAHARLNGTVRVHRARRTADVEITVDSGPLVRFGDLSVRGNVRIPTSSVLARVAWSRGEVFDVDKISLTRKALFELGAFRSVLINYEQMLRQPVADMEIVVREGQRYELKLGGGLRVEGAGGIIQDGVFRSADTRLEIRGRGELTVRSWLDPLMTLHLGLRPGYVVLPGPHEERGFVFEARAGVDRQDFLLPRLTFSSFASYAREQYEAYSEYGPRGVVLLERPMWTDGVEIGVGLHAALLTLNASQAVDPAALGVSGPLGVVLLQQNATLDRRDDRLSPRSGWFGQARLEEGLWSGGASGAFVRALAELRGYLPLAQRVVLAARARGGWIGTSEHMEPPITQRFFSGGSFHRGFGVRRLAPGVPDNSGRTVPVGGAALIEASLEMRVALRQLFGSWLGGVVFADLGDVAAITAELGPPHVAVGVGLRYQTPLGAVRLDVGRRLNRLRPCVNNHCPDPDPDRPLVFHLSVGEAF